MKIRQAVVVLGGGLLFALGCASSPEVRYYTLAVRLRPEPSGTVQTVPSPRVIGVGPVALADYLNQPYVTVRSGEHTLARTEFDRWGGSFRDTVTRALAGNLAVALANEHVVALPWDDTAVTDFRLQLSLNRFERTADAVVLQGAWFMTTEGSRIALRTGDLHLSEPTAGADTAATVAAMSRALEAACEAIAAEIRPVLLRTP